MKKIILVSMAMSLLTLSACTHLNTVSLTSIPPKRDNPIKAETSRFIVLGLNFDNDFVDQMTTQLKNQCNDGMISGVLTKDEIVNYFLYIFVTHKVTATAYCSKATSGRVGQSTRPRHPSSEQTPEAAPEYVPEAGHIE